MDAIKFIKERDRMCKTYGNCSWCPAGLDNECIVARRSGYAPEQQVNTVKVWAEQFPLKKRKTAFLEHYPNARVDSEGIPCICPASVYGDTVCFKETENCKILCYDCRREFWTHEQEEN